MTYTLFRLGYLNYSPDIEKYSISSGVLELAYSVFMSHELHVFARPFMQKLAENLDTTTERYRKTNDRSVTSMLNAFLLPLRPPTAITMHGGPKRDCLSVISGPERDADPAGNPAFSLIEGPANDMHP